MIKKLIISILVIAILAGGAYIGIKIYKNQSSSNNPINAYSVNNFVGNYYEYSEGYSGTVQNSTSQNVYVNTNQIVKEMKVTEGQNVKVGEVLLIYDTTALELQLETNKARLEQTRTSLTVAEHRLEKLNRITPVKDNYVPEPTEIEKAFDAALKEKNDVEDIIREFEMADANTQPVYESTNSAIEVFVKQEALMDAVKYITCLNAPIIISSPTDATVVDPLDKTPSKEEYEKLREDAINRLKLAQAELDLAKVNAEQVLNALKEELAKKTEIFEKAQQDYDEEQKKKGEEETYTESELARAKKSANEEIRDLGLSIRQQELSIRQQEKTIEDGVVVSKMDGVVITADSSEEKISSGKPVITVSGGGAVEIRSSINEWKKDSMLPGTPCSIYCYETGNNYEGTVKEIGTTPTMDAYYYNGSTASNYPMIISVQDADDLTIGSWVEVKFSDSDSSGFNADEIVLPTALTKSENGNYYVMKDVGGRLVKQYVKTGKIYYGTNIVVKEGITPGDYIAFPYDKNAYEGKACVDVDDLSSLYGY